jgi:hypothetical protein
LRPAERRTINSLPVIGSSFLLPQCLKQSINHIQTTGKRPLIFGMVNLPLKKLPQLQKSGFKPKSLDLGTDKRNGLSFEFNFARYYLKFGHHSDFLLIMAVLVRFTALAKVKTPTGKSELNSLSASNVFSSFLNVKITRPSRISRPGGLFVRYSINDA